MEGVAVFPLLGVKSRSWERKETSVATRVSERAMDGRGAEQWVQEQGKPQWVRMYCWRARRGCFSSMSAGGGG